LAAGLAAALHAVSVLRVHDVEQTVQAVRVWRAIHG
jgi:dihydropteroate synthase